MASVPLPFSSTKETTNYARLCRLLVDMGSQALRDTFDKIHPPATLHTVLSHHSVHHATLQSLYKGKRKVLNPTQWGKLYPVHSPVTSASFDITLLTVLLRNICGLTPPATGWDSLPPATATSVADDIARVKYYRNTVYGHASQASVDDRKLNAYWQEIRDTLVRLGGVRFGVYIDSLEHDCIDPAAKEHYCELMAQWKKDDDNIKDKLEEMEDNMEKLKSEIGSISLKLDNLLAPREEVNDEDNIRDDLEKMKSEIGSISLKLDNLLAPREEVNDEDNMEKLKSEIGSISLKLDNLLAPREEVNDEVVGSGDAERSIVTAGNSDSTTVNSLMSTNVNPPGSGSCTANFAGANIRDCTFQIYHGIAPSIERRKRLPDLSGEED